ncbi:hypothetical protein ACP0A7_01725 [Metamycoplasma hominis]|uniref:hypothetical protein n=1 Tax=Metamycoplasma hominis TaxID=2098 RepID=UPI00193C7858|nr:hypothetical protein [Metamycoplasma hominis]
MASNQSNVLNESNILNSRDFYKSKKSAYIKIFISFYRILATCFYKEKEEVKK